MELKKYPKEIVQKRNVIECNFVFSLYKDPTYIDDYKNVSNGIDIITEDGIFYYGLALELYKAGYLVFDNISIYTFLSDKEILKDGFESRGGYRSVQEIISLLNIDNIVAYYDELIKNNMMIRLHDAGFNISGDIDKINQMSSNELYDYYDYKLNNICVGKIDKIKPENLSEGYEQYIKEWDQGKSVGYKVGFPLLNYRLAGVHKKNLLLHLAHIGNGKTTTAILFYIMPVLESGENVCIIGNEQSVDEFRQMILSSVLFNKIEYFKMNRQKLIIGHFTDEDKEHLNKAEQWLKNCKGKLQFIELNDYSISNVKKIIKKFSKLNVGMFVFDTLKPEQENSDKAWAEFSEVAKELFLLAKKEDVALVATAQLSSDSMGRRFLDLSCTGKSRAIAETASQVVMFRSLSSDEKEKLKPYQFQKTEDGKYSKTRKIIDIDINKDYIVIFTPKNRFGDISPQIIYERNMSFNTMKEIGYIEINYDGYKTR
jgi:replicative DNA helicase